MNLQVLQVDAPQSRGGNSHIEIPAQGENSSGRETTDQTMEVTGQINHRSAYTMKSESSRQQRGPDGSNIQLSIQ